MTTAMIFAERVLRQMLGSPRRDLSGQLILDRVSVGEKVLIKMDDGRTLRLADHLLARLALQELFGWVPKRRLLAGSWRQ